MAKINKFYNNNVDYEWDRLDKDAFHRLEFDTTIHFLNKYLPKQGQILDAGGGPGRYSIHFAKKGYKVSLFDYSEKLLHKATKEVQNLNLQEAVVDITQGSITDLSAYKDNQFEACICLGGPLSHVETHEARTKALKEMKRVTKTGGIIVLGVIGRIAVITKALKYWPDEMDDQEDFMKLITKGDDNKFHGDYFAHMFLPEEFINFVENSNIEILNKVGLEGIGEYYPEDLNQMSIDNKERYNKWLEYHFKTCTDPTVFGMSGHMLIIGRNAKDS